MNAIARLSSPLWLRLVLLLVGLELLLDRAAAADWPKDAEVSEGSTSPDGRYGIVLSSEGTEANGKSVNYLADLKEQRVLGKIVGSDYDRSAKHRSLRTFWSSDSRWCVLEYGDRHGFSSIFVLELAGRGIAQMDVGKPVEKALDDAITRLSRAREGGRRSSAWFRLGPGRTLRVRATASNNWKHLEDLPTAYVAFAGTFDMKSRRWLTAGARQISEKDDEAMSLAYADIGTRGLVLVSEDEEHPEDFRGESYTTEEERTERLEEMLNSIYRIVRLTLPPARFAAVKAEQIEWLKQRGALPSAPEKAKLTFARIKTLQDLVW